ncbi:MAG: DUF1576 domain-containing protein [Spirochaetales bacterium]|nr:DUF1576 domain-containing protein [Spirochaetales bacterium]
MDAARFRIRRAAGGIDADAKIINRATLSFVLALLGFGFWKSGFDPTVVWRGLLVIVREPDILINDYVALAGLGPAFVNAGLLALAAWGLLRVTGVLISGPALAAIFTVAGFSLFGKNPFNVWPIVVGVMIFTWVERRPFKDNIIVALFGTALAPIVSEFAFGIGIASPWNLLAGVVAGLAAGFFLTPVARGALDFTRGYNLYNIGFAAGFVGTVTMSALRAFNVPLSGGFAWAENGPDEILPFLALYFASMIVIGLVEDEDALPNLLDLLRTSGRLVSDYPRSFGIGATLLNMGLMGFTGSLLALAAGCDWNGPVVGGIFTLVGFSAFGKHPLNALPPMLGVMAAASLTPYGLEAPGSQLALLFSATLAPIAGAYGPVAGFIAGLLHLTLVHNVGHLHGGLDLYNNGFSGGMVAGIMVPMLDWIRERRRHEP